MWLDAATDISPHGRGVAHAVMSDREGVLAHVVAAAAREPPVRHQHR